MAAKPQHIVLVSAAALLLAGSAAVFGVLGWKISAATHVTAPTGTLRDAPYFPSVADAANASSDGWNPPPALPRGRDWVYDTFTPPGIYYNSRSHQFTVRPPSGV